MITLECRFTTCFIHGFSTLKFYVIFAVGHHKKTSIATISVIFLDALSPLWCHPWVIVTLYHRNVKIA